MLNPKNLENTLKIITDFENNKMDIRDKKLKYLIEYNNYTESYLDGYTVYLMESMGYNTSLSKFIDIISDQIFDCISKKINKTGFDLIIKQLGVTDISITLSKEEETSIIKDKNKLIIKYCVLNIPTIDIIRSEIDHELHHIFINQMGNVTNKNYFIVNDLIPKYNGKTKAFLTLYYLSFKDEISCNIQMSFRQIRIENIKNKDQFINFLKNSKIYNIADKMINIDILSYWNEIVKEGNDEDLTKELDIKNLNEFLTKTSIFIKKAGSEYKRRLSKIFI